MHGSKDAMNKETSREWAEFTKKAMELAGVSQVDLARKLTKKLGRTITQGALQARLNNPRSQPPKDDELRAWADILRLEGFHRQQFERLALFTRTPLPIRKELMAVEDRAERLEKRLGNLEKQDSDLRRQLTEAKIHLAEATSKAEALLAKFTDLES